MRHIEFEPSRPLAPLTISERWRLFTQQSIVRMSFAVGVVAIILGYWVGNLTASPKFQTSTKNSTPPTVLSATTTLPPAVVFVTGEVAKPGVIELSASDRIADAIERAGGVTANGSITSCNIASRLTDGMMITIPSKKSPIQSCSNTSSGSPSSTGLATSSTENTGLVSLNSASQSQLEELPGVGPTLAQAIISYREKSPFSSVNDLRKVKGIGDKRFADLKDLVTL
jgi:competence protein ComEA